MRIFNKEKNIVVIKKKNIVILFSLFVIVLFSVKLYNTLEFYSEELRQMIKVKSNNMFQDVVNDAVYKVCKQTKFKFTDISYIDGLVASINYNTNAINSFKAEIVKEVSKNINKKDMIFKVFLSDGFKNVYFVNKGPSFDVRCIPYNAIKVECFSKFEDVGVNQSKNTIWIEISTDIYSSGLAFNTINSFSYSVAVSETIIVGEVPESYTNVSGDDNVNDKVLNLQ